MHNLKNLNEIKYKTNKIIFSRHTRNNKSILDDLTKLSSEYFNTCDFTKNFSLTCREVQILNKNSTYYGCITDSFFNDFLNFCGIETNWILNELIIQTGFDYILQIKTNDYTIYSPIIGMYDGFEDIDYYAILDIYSATLDSLLRAFIT